MFKEFNVKFEDAEIIGGADNLLEGTGVTKVILRGDNKLSSLDSTFKNCSQLDTIDGGLNLDGISDVDSLLEGTNLVTSIDLKNVNNKDITANNSFSHVNQINIGGETYNKEAIQTIISSREWTFNNVNYVDTVGEDVVTHTPNITEEDENTQIVINDALEQKVRDIEIKGQTYQNLIQGKEGAELLADIKLESIDGSPSELEPPIDHPVCVEVIEGQTYQNLIEGKGGYNLTDTYNATWTESNSSFEDIPDVVEIPEIWGNTIQDENNLNIIQSVGDLYVDEEGNPILDEEDNEQYKLEVISRGKNLCPQSFNIVSDGSQDYMVFTENIFVKPNTNYYIKDNLNLKYQWHEYDKFGTRTSTKYPFGYGTSITTSSNTSYVKLRTYSGYADESVKVQIEEGDSPTDFEPYVESKITILMPQPLRKVGKYSDKLYWDYNKNKFLMDIGTQIVKATTTPNYILVKESDEFVTVSLHHNYLIGMEGTGSFCSLLPQIKSYNATEEGFCYVAPLFYFTLRKNKLDNSTVGYALAVRNWLVNNNATFICPKKSKTIETKILEKLSLKTYSPKTHISTNTEIQPSRMTLTNKRNVFLPLRLQANKDYTLQLDSVGKDDKPITVNLGGSEITTQPVNDTSKHHKVVIKTPSTLTSDKIELSGEGVVVNDVMLFEGGEDIIKQEVEYIEGIQNIGELQEDGTYKIDIRTNNNYEKLWREL